jgi:hypothetical protein
MSVDPERLLPIEQNLEEALERRARLLAGYQAGVRGTPDLGRLARRWPALLDPETLQQVLEAAAFTGEAPTREQRRAARLAAGVIDWRAWSAGADAEAEGLAARDGAGVAVELEVISFRNAVHELVTAADPIRRKALARGVDGAWLAAEPRLTEAAMRRLETRASLQPGGAAGELRWGELDTWAEKLLSFTRDAAFDVLDFLFRRAGLGGRSRGSGWADLRYALEIGSLREHLPPSQLWPLAASFVSGMGLDPQARGAIALDIDDRDDRETGALVAAFRVPGEIALLQRPSRTPADLYRLLGALGEAQQQAGLAADAPLSERALSDAAHGAAAGAGLQAILFRPEWHRRFLRLPSRLALEMARAFATRSLVELRVACAHYLSARQVASRGLSPATREDFRERLAQATGADGALMGWFEGSPETWAAQLRGSALAGRRISQLQEELDEDYWRNPRTGPLLEDLWKSSGAELADAPGSSPAEAWSAEKEAARLVEQAAL